MLTNPRAWRMKWRIMQLVFSWIFRASPKLFILIFSVAMAGGLISIAEPWVFQQIIDALVDAQQKSMLLLAGIMGLFIAYGVVRLLSGISWDVQNLLRRMFTQRIEHEVHYRIMGHVSNLDAVYFEEASYYNTLTRATSNLWRLIDTFWSSNFLVSEVVAIFAIVGILFTFDWRIVVLIVAGAIPSIVLSLRWADTLWSAYADSSPIARRASYYKSMMTEQPEAAREIRIFGLRDFFLQRFYRLYAGFLRSQDRVALAQMRWYVVISLIEGVTSVIAAWLVGEAFLQGEISIGSVTFYWALLFQFAAHVRWVVRMVSDMNTHLTFLSPLLTITRYRPQVKEPRHPMKFPERISTGIEFRGVSFRYPRSGRDAIHNISFRVSPGQSIALVGENGSGKTTLVKLLTRLYDPTMGEIFVDGITLPQFSLSDLYDHVGVIFQDFMKYEALAKENIHYGRIESEMLQTAGGQVHRSVHHAAVKSGAWEFVRELDRKYETMLGKRLVQTGVELSAGQWQKIALARAFFRDPDILVLDEPTAAVDAKAEYNLFRRFKQFTRRKITILISHRFSTVRMADIILVMHHGRIVESGSHAQLMRKNGRYAKLFRMQARAYQE